MPGRSPGRTSRVPRCRRAVPIAAALAGSTGYQAQQGSRPARPQGSPAHPHRHHRRGRQRPRRDDPGVPPHPGVPAGGRREHEPRVEPARRHRVQDPEALSALEGAARRPRHRRGLHRHLAVHAPHADAGIARTREARALPGAHGQQRAGSARDAGRVAAAPGPDLPARADLGELRGGRAPEEAPRRQLRRRGAVGGSPAGRAAVSPTSTPNWTGATARNSAA